VTANIRDLAVVLFCRDLSLHLNHLHQTEHQLHAYAGCRPYGEVHLQPLLVLRSLHHIELDRTVLRYPQVQVSLRSHPDPVTVAK
jgi:hypothetical protein